MPHKNPYNHITSKKDLSADLAKLICETLKEALKERGAASLMVSGGNSPLPVYEKLSEMDLDWSRVNISLVDDRWVGRESSGSNAASIQNCLIKNKAATANFIDLKTHHASPIDALVDVENRIGQISYPFDMCIMGMGTDGHTASWFPNSIGLKTALNIDSDAKVAAITASNSPGAGDYPERITLTLPAVMSARAIALYIPGPEKLKVFENSANCSIYDAPVSALRAAGSRLTVFSGNL